MAAIVGKWGELFFWPGSTVNLISNFTLNQTTDAAEYIFQAREPITITRVGYRQGTVTGTAPTYVVALQGVDGSGFPDGVTKVNVGDCSVSVTPVSGGNSTWVWKTLDNSYTCTRGEWLSLVISTTGTVDASNNSSFAITGVGGVQTGEPFSIQNDNAVRTKQGTTPLFGYASAGTAYGWPLQTSGSSAFNSASTPDEKAVLFNIPTTWWSTYKVYGVAMYGAFTAGTTCDFVLYDTDGTSVLQNFTADTDQDHNPTASRRRVFIFDETTLSTLNAGSSYRLSIKPSATSATIQTFTVGATADMDAYFGGATVAQGSTRTDAGGWTDSNVTRWGLNPLLSDITAPSANSNNGIFFAVKP